MKFVRKLHLYLGVFFAPLLLFYIGSGWYQTVTPARLKSAADAESLVQKFRVVHTDQIYPGGGDVRRQSPKAFQVLVVGMSLAMIVSTLLGLLVAIPALISWSYYSKKVENLTVELETLCDEFLRKHYHSKGADRK